MSLAETALDFFWGVVLTTAALVMAVALALTGILSFSLLATEATTLRPALRLVRTMVGGFVEIKDAAVAVAVTAR